MLCHITDYDGYNPHEDDHLDELMEESKPKFSLENFSLIDLMNAEISMYLSKRKKGFKLEINGECDENLLREHISQGAARHLAMACKDYLFYYNMCQNKD